jgi:hypothetical protein
MRHHGFARRFGMAAAIVAGFWAVSAASSGGFVTAPAARAATCFSVATDIVCIDGGMQAPPATVPPILIPTGANGDGVDEEIVIRDDGGYQVARG